MSVKTNCAKCVYNKKLDGIQVGCEAEVKDKILSQFPDIYQETNISNIDGSWVIDDFLCPIGRTKEESTVEQAHKETNIGVYLIYFIDKNVDIFEQNLKMLSESFTKIRYLSIVKDNKYSDMKSSDIIALLQKYNICTWKVHNIVIEDMTYCEIVDLVLSSTTRANNTQYYCIWDNTLIPDYYINTINDTVKYLQHRSPVISAYKTEPFVIGCAIPFSIYCSDSMRRSHGLVIQNVLEENNYNRLIFSIS